MLLLDSRGQKILISICNNTGKILYKNILPKPCDTVFNYIQSTLHSFDSNFCPTKIGVTITPGMHSSIIQSLNFAKVKNI